MECTAWDKVQRFSALRTSFAKTQLSRTALLAQMHSRLLEEAIVQYALIVKVETTACSRPPTRHVLMAFTVLPTQLITWGRRRQNQTILLQKKAVSVCLVNIAKVLYRQLQLIAQPVSTAGTTLVPTQKVSAAKATTAQLAPFTPSAHIPEALQTLPSRTTCAGLDIIVRQDQATILILQVAQQDPFLITTWFRVRLEHTIHLMVPVSLLIAGHVQLVWYALNLASQRSAIYQLFQVQQAYTIALLVTTARLTLNKDSSKLRPLSTNVHVVIDVLEVKPSNQLLTLTLVKSKCSAKLVIIKTQKDNQFA